MRIPETVEELFAVMADLNDNCHDGSFIMAYWQGMLTASRYSREECRDTVVSYYFCIKYNEDGLLSCHYAICPPLDKADYPDHVLCKEYLNGELIKEY